MDNQPVSFLGRALSPFLLAIGLLASPLSPAATPLQPFALFNTGVDKRSETLPGATVDPHYTIVSSPDAAYPGPDAMVTAAIAEGYWMPNGPNSRWIAPTANQEYPEPDICNASGKYIYRTTFDLTGFDPATAVIEGSWMADNWGIDILVNGVSTEFISLSYNTFIPFNLTSGFVAGKNTIDFVVSDTGCPTGIRVEISKAEAAPVLGPDTTPDPFSFPSRNNVVIFAPQISDPVTPTGYNAPALISVANGTYSIGCGFSFTYTSAPGTINPGQSVCVQHYAGEAGVSVTTTLTIGGVSGTFTTITAGGAVLALSPASLTFGIQLVGTTSPGQVVTLTNSGASAAAYLSGITGDFSIASQTCNNSSLPAGASCTFTVVFTPTALGSRTGTLATYNGAVGTLSVALAGTGNDPNATPGPFSFPTKNNVPSSTAITSDAVTPLGYTSTAPISVADGEYSIGCSLAFTSAAGIINPGQSVCVRHASSDKALLATTTTLTIGEAFATFRSYTASSAAIPQEITFDHVPGRSINTKPFDIFASGGSSGLPVTFRSRATSVCTVSGSTVTLVSVGQCAISANQAGNGSYSAAPEVTLIFQVDASGQVITFEQPATQTVGIPLTISATSSSHLAVALTSLTPAVCTASGTTVTFGSGGLCTIAANQAGNGNYSPAPEVRRSFAVIGGFGGVAKIAAGGYHSCALTTAGGVKCWGDNTYGQLGDNSTDEHHGAVDVPGLASVVAIAAGGYHTCAVTAGGAVKCWGRNDAGQLGDDSHDQRLVPVGVYGLSSGIAAISAGEAHTCALTTGGTVLCWGDNLRGQIDDLGPYYGPLESSSRPVNLLAARGLASDVVALSAGAGHNCALTAAGAVKCWGDNLHNATGERFVMNDPLQGFTSGFTAIAAGGAHSCALTTGGAVKCLGRLLYYATNYGSWLYFDYPHPIDIDGAATGVAAVTAGYSHSCLLTSGGGVKCWGDGTHGELGFGSPAYTGAAGNVVGLASGVASISAGYAHTCALTTSGTVKCWGNNDYGQLGDNSDTTRQDPVDVQNDVDNIPRAFSFTSQAGVFVGEVRQSNAIVPAGYNQPAPLSVSGGEYSIGCTATFTTAAGVINPGQSVCVRHVASSAYVTSVTTTLTIGGVAGTFVSTTATRPSLSLSVTGLSFGGQSVGTASAAQLVTVTNPGGHPASGLDSGVNGDFGIASSTCASTLAPAASCTLSLTFTPLSLGGRTGDLQVFASNTVPASIHVPLFGTGTFSDVTPNAFSFVDQFLVATNTVVTSAPVQITGLTSAAPVMVIGGTFAVSSTNSCTGDVVPFGSAPAMVANNQYVCVRHTTSAVPGGSNDTQLIVGGLGDTFTTVTKDTVPAAFALGSQLNVAPSTIRTSAAVAISGINAPATFTVTGGEISVNCTGTFASSGSLAPGSSICARHLAGATFNVTTTTTVTVGGVSSTFTTTTFDANGDADGDGIPNGVEYNEARNPEAKDNDVFANNRLFAMQQYRDFLAREGDAAGIVGWAAFLDAGTYDRLQVIDAFLSSNEFAGFVAPVVRLYFATFLRVPDYAGLTFNAGLVRDGTVTVVQLADFFTHSPEFMVTYGALTDAQFVTLLYQNVLGRAPDQAGLDGWVAFLRGGYTRGQVLLGFSDSVEYQAAMANEVFVTMMYAGMLHRSPEPTGFSGWLNYLDTAQLTRAQVINGFFLSTEYHDRFLP